MCVYSFAFLVKNRRSMATCNSKSDIKLDIKNVALNISVKYFENQVIISSKCLKFNEGTQKKEKWKIFRRITRQTAYTTIYHHIPPSHVTFTNFSTPLIKGLPSSRSLSSCPAVTASRWQHQQATAVLHRHMAPPAVHSRLWLVPWHSFLCFWLGNCLYI